MNRDCELVEIIERFFNVINCNKQDIECDDIDDVTEFENLDDKYSYCCAGYSEKIEKVKELLADKRKVYYGRCEDQGVEIEEIFLSNYNYEISNKDFYFDFGNSFF
jgi:hypothetical protein